MEKIKLSNKIKIFLIYFSGTLNVLKTEDGRRKTEEKAQGSGHRAQ